MDLYYLHSNPKLLDHHAEAYDKVPALIWKKYEYQPKKLKKYERVLAKTPHTAYEYSYNVLNTPFPAGEAALAKTPSYAFRYARDVLKGPFPAGEAAIATNSRWAYWYAKNVLNGPFPAGEAAIAKDSYFALRYFDALNFGARIGCLKLKPRMG